MSVTTLEIKPDRLLMDSNFDGYKLSLKELKQTRKSLEVPVDKTSLNSSQYSLLHAKLFGLHNHLFVDQFDGFSSLYFVDRQFNIQKIYLDSNSNELVDPVAVYRIPKTREQATGDYNPTLRFASAGYAVISDGMGTMYILDTKDKKDDDQFDILFSGPVLSNETQGFVVSDALYNDAKQELHALLLHIQEDSVDRFISVIHWLTFKKAQNNVWDQVALRQLKSKGEVQYLHLENSCDNIYVVAENAVKFALNSEHPIVENQLPEKSFQWSQDTEDITVTIPLPEIAQKSLVKVFCVGTELNVEYNSRKVLWGNLEGSTDSSLLAWTLNGNILEIQMTKTDKGQYWKQLLKGDNAGEQIFDTKNQKLQEYTTDKEEGAQDGATFNYQQTEECDFETDMAETFERISGVTNSATHRIHLGSHHVLLSPFLQSHWPPALGIRHDVDVCLWQPIWSGQDFICKHEGTLLAFGYVQASKTNRKFVTCSPNLDYAVVSESTGHIFIYGQNKPLLSSELRHRTTGRRVKRVAQQQVLNFPNQNILGIFAGNTHLFVLGEDFVAAFSINSEPE